MSDDADAGFAAFFADVEPRLRLALSAGFGLDLGREAAADALAWAWDNWDRLSEMTNPAGYLYRVGQSVALRELEVQRRGGRLDSDRNGGNEVPGPYPFEPSLADHLAELSEQQQVCLWLVHGLGYRQSDVADLLGCSPSSVATHVRRALARLRTRMVVDHER